LSLIEWPPLSALAKDTKWQTDRSPNKRKLKGQIVFPAFAVRQRELGNRSKGKDNLYEPGKRSDARIFDLVKICTVWLIVGMAEKKINFRQTTNVPAKAVV
jgi:hypothetical protein